MKLRCYALTPDPPALTPASAERPWMDAAAARHPYRCLPMAIANSYGWDVLSPCSFAITWTGGPETAAITFEVQDGYPNLAQHVVSHFANGIVTFHTGYLFRTEPGWNLFVTGSLNRPKHGIAPLQGIVETDWLPFPFTMNWQMTAPGTVAFARGEPFCTVFPVRQGMIEEVEPEIHAIESDPELLRDYAGWRDRRASFNQKYDERDPETLRQSWQRHYFRGELPERGVKAESHQSKLRPKDPVDRRGK